jgi:hypothetical protein
MHAMMTTMTMMTMMMTRPPPPCALRVETKRWMGMGRRRGGGGGRELRGGVGGDGCTAPAPPLLRVR